MKFKRNKVLSLLLLTFALNACSSSTDKRILGTIEGKEYTVDSFLSMFLSDSVREEQKKNKTPIPDDSIREVFQQFADFTIFSSLADKSGFFESHPDKKTTLDTQIENIQRKAYLIYLQDTTLKPLMDKASVSDKDLKPYKKRVQVRHILLSNKDRSTEEIATLQANILKELKNGTKFEDLAKKYSDDPGSKDGGGLISQWIYEATDNLVPEFTAAALSGKKNGDIIPDVVSDFGTHIIYIENIQNRSSSDIKENDPQVYSQILQTKKEEIAKEFDDKMMKDFTIEKTPELNIGTYFKTYSTENQDQVLFTINKTIPYTGKQFVNEVLQGDTKQLVTLATIPDLDKLIEEQVIKPIILAMYAKKQGADNDDFTKNTIYVQTIAYKAALYTEELLKTKAPKKQKMPNFSVTDKEINDFFEQNKDSFSKPNKDGKINPAKLTPALKGQIKASILTDKEKQFQQDQANIEAQFLNNEAKKYYDEYKITFNKDFIKKAAV